MSTARHSTVARLVGICGCIFLSLNPLFSEDHISRITPTSAYHLPYPSGPEVKVDVRMVLVPVTVTDSMDYPVVTLPRTSFQIYEDNIEQNVLTLQKEDGPVSVGFVVDTSGSMRDRMEPSIAAIRQFLERSMTGDEYFLLRFSSDSDLIVNFTEHPEEIRAALPSLKPEGSTALNDAIYRAVHEMKRARNGRKALFVLTDGGDNDSRYSDSEVRKLVQEADVRVYSIGLFTRPGFLTKLAGESGARTFWVKRMSHLPEAVEKLSQELRNEYVLGYCPRNSATDGKYRRIRVRLAQESQNPPLHLSWRRGYYAPEH